MSEAAIDDSRLKMRNARLPGHLLRRLHQRSTQIFQRVSGEAGHGLTSVQYAALTALADNPNIDQACLSSLIGYDRATIGGVVERLEQKGYLTRTINEKDRRARSLGLTAQGAALVAEFTPSVIALQKEILANLDKKERRKFIALAQKALGLDMVAGDG